mgnify:CR=1 FL=1
MNDTVVANNEVSRARDMGGVMVAYRLIARKFSVDASFLGCGLSESRQG